MDPVKEVAKFIARSAGPEKLKKFRPSAVSERRIIELLRRQRDGNLRQKDRHELQLFVLLDHMMSLAKAQA